MFYSIFCFFVNLIQSYFTEKTKQKELDTLEPLSTILECAYCNSKNIMTFLPDENERIEFECVSCKKKNLVNIQFVVARITDTVTINTGTNIPLIDEKDES